MNFFRNVRQRSAIRSHRPGHARGPAAASGAASRGGAAPAPPRRPPRRASPADPDLAAIWEAVQRLTETVEKDHSERLGRIERDMKWVMRLVTAVLAAVLGAAASGLVPQ